ncbi:hypothetical protein RMAECT_1133 [Rickettsia rhipicephali str. Ect]|uniref:Uncharacterized protein n=1 Tax=Rickettsia rhipicephali str. Ect TaxID=1359199 RepID=A0A0F3PH04_RICRH|nr:hypothetical protein RMAECT_1133 [Rickettsia rhipicephali str. Ect]
MEHIVPTSSLRATSRSVAISGKIPEIATLLEVARNDLKTLS